MEKIYMLYHESKDKDIKLIGFYSAREKAKEAMAGLVSQQGFKDYPEGFKIRAMTIDKDYHTKGFKSKYLFYERYYDNSVIVPKKF